MKVISRRALVAKRRASAINRRRAKAPIKKGFKRSKGKSKYKQGKFWSKKNRKEYVFRSAYEFAYFHILEEDENVVSYVVEPFSVGYLFNGIRRAYWPDLLVLYKDGSMEIIEIKPLVFVNKPQVQAKAKGCRRFIGTHLPNTTYRFVTEKDIFASEEDYMRLLASFKAMKNKKG